MFSSVFQLPVLSELPSSVVATTTYAPIVESQVAQIASLAESWTGQNIPLLLRLTWQHLLLSLPPIVLGLIIAVPLGWWLSKHPRIQPWALGVIGLLYTIPSLAIFVLLPPLLGTSVLSPLNVVVALTCYGVALLTHNAVKAFAEIRPELRQSAIALGYSGGRYFWQVELPLAGPVILAGLRVVAVSTISLVSVGVLVGVESLGYLFTNGLQRAIPEMIIAGILFTLLLAVLIDRLLQILGRLSMPWLQGTR